MTPPRAPARRAIIGRSALLAVALALTVAGMCLVAFAGSTALVRVGFPVALWGVLLAAWALPGWGRGLSPASGADRLETGYPHPEPVGRSDLERAQASDLTAVRQDLAGLRADLSSMRAVITDAIDGGRGPRERMPAERAEASRIVAADPPAAADDVHRPGQWGHAALDTVPPPPAYVGRRRRA